jgi:hypothetical protein
MPGYRADFSASVMLLVAVRLGIVDSPPAQPLGKSSPDAHQADSGSLES